MDKDRTVRRAYDFISLVFLAGVINLVLISSVAAS